MRNWYFHIALRIFQQKITKKGPTSENSQQMPRTTESTEHESNQLGDLQPKEVAAPLANPAIIPSMLA